MVRVVHTEGAHDEFRLKVLDLFYECIGEVGASRRLVLPIEEAQVDRRRLHDGQCPLVLGPAGPECLL
jgi:hypothetical protein